MLPGNWIARTFVWLLLPALLVAGLPGSLCACLVAAQPAKACCGAVHHAAAGKCCCTDAKQSPCDCCPKDAPSNKGECGCKVQAAKPAVTPDAQVATHFDLAPQWVTWDLTAVAVPCAAEATGWQFSLPPPDLVIEFRNLRI